MESEPLALRSSIEAHGLAQTSSDRSLSPSSATDSAAEDVIAVIRPFACPLPGCTRRFRRKYTLKDHMNTHTGEKPFVCPVRSCGKRFTASGNLSRHRRSLHPWLDTPLPCLVDGCECEFLNEEKLQRHMVSHFENSCEYQCVIGTCGRVFTSTGNLRRHIKQNHTYTPEAERLKLGSRPRPPSPALAITPNQSVEIGDALPAPLLFPAPKDHQIKFDDELLEALACLLDDDTVESL